MPKQIKQNLRERSHKPQTNVKGIRPAGVNQLGAKYGDHVTERPKTGFRGEPMREGKSFQPCGFGNEQTMGTNGPGKGMNLYGKSGTNQQYGAANPGNAPNKSTDILKSYGPDYRAKGSR